MRAQTEGKREDVGDRLSHGSGRHVSSVDQGHEGPYGTCRGCGRPIRLTTIEENGTRVIRARCCPQSEAPRG